MKRLMLLASVVVAAVSCSQTQSEPNSAVQETPLPGGFAAKVLIADTGFGTSEAFEGGFVINSEAEWDALYQTRMAFELDENGNKVKSPVLDVDYTHEMVLGYQFANGSGLAAPKLHSILRVGNGIIVKLEKELPGLNCNVLTALSSPAIVFKLPRHEFKRGHLYPITQVTYQVVETLGEPCAF